MVNPAPGYPVTTRFGKPGSWAAGFHPGEDRACPTGSKIVAAESGTVVYSGNGGGWGSAYGQQVIIDTNGRRHLYAHLKSRTVSYGQRVKRGQLIGYADNTGRSFGPHLHYEERISPYRYGSDSKQPILPALSSGSTSTTTTECLGDYCYGKEADAHRALQRRLFEKGHDPGYGDWPTRLYGDGTKSAMAAFQRSLGWSGPDADGMPGPATLDNLGLPQELAYRSSKRVYLSKMVIGQGDSDSVWNIQIALLLRGYSIPAGPTDYFGNQTKAAVKEFQEDQGWTGSDADGIPGPGTIQALGLQAVDDLDDPDTSTPPPTETVVPDAPAAPEKMAPGVQWKPIRKGDGWVTGLRKFSTSPGGEPKIVVHTTETKGIPNWDGMSGGYPHYTADLDNDDIRMHIPHDMAAFTLKGGTHSPNSAAGVVIQIEVVGYASEVASWSQEKCEKLKALLMWIAVQIKCAYTFPAPFTDDAGYGIGGEVRMDWEPFRLTTGILGHSHAPYNDHWDPGEFPVEKFLKEEPEPVDPVEPLQGGALALLMDNGWAEETWDEVNTALGVMYCESGGFVDAVGDLGIINEKWGPSVGLGQVRTLQEVENWAGQPDGVRDIEKLRDPAEQVKAIRVLKNQYGWQQWSVHPDSAERKGLDPNGPEYDCFRAAKGKDFLLLTGHENSQCWSLSGCEEEPVEPEKPIDPEKPVSSTADVTLRATLSAGLRALADDIDALGETA